MKSRNLIVTFLLSLVVMVMTGCGGGGGATASGPSISGTASKGPINGGDVAAFQIFSSHDPSKATLAATPFFSGKTGTDGSYSIPLPASITKDSVMVRITNGSYKDEATLQPKDLATEYPNGLSVVVKNNGSGQLTGQVTPFTEMAVRAATALDDNAMSAAYDKIEAAFGLVDIDLTKPLNPDVAPPAGADDNQKAYTKALAVLAQYGKENPAKNLDGICDDLVNEIKTLDALSADTVNKITTSELNYDNSGNNKTGVPSKSVPTITVATNKATAAINGIDSVLITANVKIGDAPLAGVEVKFSVKSGPGSLSENSVVTDGSGNASVNLTSTAAGTTVVTAMAGLVSADSSAVNFIVQPTEAVVVLGTEGTLPAGVTIGALDAELLYSTDGLSITSANIGLSGSGLAAGTNSFLIPNTTTAGVVTLGLISGTDVGVGMPAGEFATLTFQVTAPKIPTAADFTLAAGASVMGLSTNLPIDGMSVKILSITLR